MAKSTISKDPWTAEQFAEWKSLESERPDGSGGLYICTMDQPTTGEAAAVAPLKFIIKKPTWPVLRLASTAYRNQDTIKAGEIIMENCYLGGHDQVKSDPLIYLAGCLEVITLFSLEVPTFSTSVVKL